MNNNELQREYYESNLDKPAMQPTRSEYVTRHLDRVIAAADLSPEKMLLEVGCGLGKFTLPLMERGYNPVCLDISSLMLESIRKNAAPREVQTLVCDVAESARHTKQRFERAIGFFTLHHMSDLTKSFKGLEEVLLPGARVAFCEPRAYNPLYYLQIALTPRMSWAAEKGLLNMRKNYVFKAFRNAGLVPTEAISYGFFPPFIVNRPWGAKLTDILDCLPWLAPAHAFQIYVAEKPT